MTTGLPVVSCPYMPAAEMPMPCWPRLWRRRWNFEPYSSFAKIGGICWRTMPGPLSATVMRKRVAWLAGGAAVGGGAASFGGVAALGGALGFFGAAGLDRLALLLVFFVAI